MKLSITMNRDEVNMGWLFFAVQVFFLPAVLIACNGILGLGLSDAQLNFTMFCINIALTVAVFHHFLWQSLIRFITNIWHSIRFAFLGFLIYYALNFALNLLIGWLMPDFSNANDENIAAMLYGSDQLFAVGLVFLVPVTEEALHRGLIFGSLHQKSPLLAYTVSMLVFAAIHVTGYIGQVDGVTLLVSFLQYLPAGFALAWAYERTDTIWSPILIHMSVNQIALTAMR